MLMYHSVTPMGQTTNWPWALPLERFRSHLDFLREAGWRTVSASELLAGAGTLPERTVAITFDDGYVDNLAAAELLRARGMSATFYVVSGSLGRPPQWPDPGRPDLLMLSPGDLRTLVALGMEVGSHTQTHPRLPDCDDKRVDQELVGSRGGLEDILGRPVTHLAYPYGIWNARCEAAARKAGYLSACTTASGWALRDGDPFRLRRLTVYGRDSASVLARKLSLGANDVAWTDLGRYGLERIRQRLGIGAHA